MSGDPTFEQVAVPQDLLDALRARFTDRCSTAMAVREQHGRDESPFTDVVPPAAVIYAESTPDVQDAVRLCARHRVPVIAYGAGSSLEGQLLAVRGGISLDVSRMNGIVAVDADDLTATVQCGVTRRQLNDALRSHGLFFPVDPGAEATLGGMCATRASGTNAVRYGTMRENVLGLEVVLASGEMMRTGTRARKSSAGYDLTRLLIGSEGTLGVMTEITLRVHPLPEAVSAATCSFDSVADAVRSVIQVIQCGVPIARVELIDANTVRMVNAYSRLGLPAAPMLLMEFHGSPTGVQEQAQAVQEIAAEHGGSGFEWATTPEARTRLWTARHHAYFAAIASHPGCRVVATDACVPISRLADCLLASIDEANAEGMAHFVVGHVGDGNFHLGYPVDPADAGHRGRAELLASRVMQRAQAVGGTCTGEHGIGLHKLAAMPRECGEVALGVMRHIKQALDPLGILNPGKVLAASVLPEKVAGERPP